MQEGNSHTNSDLGKMSIETTFQLRRSGVSSACVSVEVDFSPSMQQKSSDQHDTTTQKTCLRSIPIFNKDKNFFTPSFILQMDKDKYIQNQHIYQTLFEKKVEQMDDQKPQIYLPRPSKTNSLCCVCKTLFDDYLTHVNLPLHKTLMQKSQFHRYIQQICSKFTHSKTQVTEKKVRGKAAKTKMLKKEQKPKRAKKCVMNSPQTRIQSSNFLGEDVRL